MGNISAAKLAESNKDKTSKDKSLNKINKKEMNKSAYDAGFSMFRTMLEYKCNIAGIYYMNIDESYTTQTCSCCGARNGPKGSAVLGIREWTCACGTIHDRDINAAINILVRGHAHLAGGISVLQGGEDVKVLNESTKKINQEDPTLKNIYDDVRKYLLFVNLDSSLDDKAKFSPKMKI